MKSIRPAIAERLDTPDLDINAVDGPHRAGPGRAGLFVHRPSRAGPGRGFAGPGRAGHFRPVQGTTVDFSDVGTAHGSRTVCLR